jgi:hypothetical protein
MVTNMENAEVAKKKFSLTSIHLRKGQWLRLAATGAAFLGIVFYLCLPQVLIAYQLYSNTSTAGVRDYLFPAEYISGTTNFFGNVYFILYQKSNLGPEVLTTKMASFNGFALTIVLLALAAMALCLWLNFTSAHEKYTKVCTLLFVLPGIMCFMGPIFFLAVNGFGAADWTASSNLQKYWIYDSLYVHDAYGAIMAGLTFMGAAVLFGLGTNAEGGDKNDIRNED